MHWRIRLGGNSNNLQKQIELCQNSSDIRIFRENDYYYLESGILDVFNTVDDVRRKGNELIQCLKSLSLLKLGSFSKVELEAVIQLDEEGKQREFVQFSLTGRSSIEHIFDEWSNIDPILLLHLQETEEKVNNVLFLINEGFSTWLNLYKIIEIMKKDGFRPVSRNGQFNNICRRIKQASLDPQSVGLLESRHYNERPPRNPIKKNEAQYVIRRIVYLWIDEKLRR